MFQFLRRLPGRTVRGALALLLVAAVALVAVTRTQVGRDALARRIEAEFSETFDGVLTIGSLTGNLLREFVAGDITVRDSTGAVSLHVDSLLVRTSWEDLVRRRIVVPRIVAIRPAISGLIVDDSLILVAGMGRRATTNDSSAGLLRFRSARILVREGSVGARRDSGSARPLGPLFDPGDLRVEDLDLEVLLDWSEQRRQVDVFRLNARGVVPELAVRSGEAQILFERDRITLNRLRLALDGTRLSAEGSLDRDGGRIAGFDLALDAPELSYDELHRLLPGLPVAGNGALGLRASGSTDGIVVPRIEMAAGRSFLVASGTAVGLPDSLDFELSVDRLGLRSADMRAFLPDEEIVRAPSFDSVVASGYTRGTAWLDGSRFDSLRADGNLVLSGDPGSVVSSFSVDLRNRSRPLLALDADLDDFDLAAFLDRVPETRLTGRIELASEGIAPRTATGDARIEITGSRIGNRIVENAVVHASADGSALRFDLAMETGESGWLRADGLWNRESPGTLSADAAWNRYDVAPLLGSDSLHTLASGRLGARFSGSDEASFEGFLDLRIDSTVVRSGRAESVVLPHHLRFDLARADAAEPRIRIGGDALEAELSGDVRLGALLAAGAFWSDALAGAVRREFDKPYPGTTGSPVAQLLENARDIRTSVLRGEVEREMTRVGLEGPLDFAVRATVHRPDVLAGWFPVLPEIRGRLLLESVARADADSLRLRLALTADSLWLAGAAVVGPRATVTAWTAFDGPVERSLGLDAAFDADSLTSGVIVLPSVALRARLRQGQGTIELETGRDVDIGPVQVRAEYGSLPDRNRLVVRQASVEARNFAWNLETASTLDLYAGGITVDGFRIVSDTSAAYGSQSIAVRGAYSGLATDTLFVDANGVRLEEVTRFASLRPALGGRLDGRASFTRSGDRPLLVGDATASGLVLDGRLIGHLALRSRLVPGTPNVDVRLDLTPADTAGLRWPEPPFEVRRNALFLAGTVRLPDSDGRDPGEWNLSLRADRADLFFLKYIFNQDIDQVRGYLAGQGSITGTLRRPVFEASLTATDGGFRVPVTGVSYTLEGGVGLSRDAVVIRDLTVRDTGGGEGRVRGNIYFNEYQYFSFGLDADLRELLIIDSGPTDDLPFYGTIRGSGTAALVGPLAAARLSIPDGITRDDSELFIPIVETAATTDESFIVFTDSTGRLPDLRQLARRPNLLARRATTERRFLDGLDLDINLFAPRGSVVRLVIDPLLGDVINAESTGRMQIRRTQGEFEIFGTLEVEGGDYLFTAGEVFVRRFIIEEGGTITWESDPIDARLDIPAVYRTRASWAGLDLGGASSSALVPLVVQLQITGRVLAPAVDLSLAVDRTNQNVLGDYQALEARLNNPERSAEYATSVLLTNSFQLTTETVDTRSGEQLAFNSVSQLVSAQLNRFLNAALPNVDVNVGLLGERASDLDITYGVALRLLDERLIIRGEGVYQGSRTDAPNVASETMQGEVVVEVRLSPTVSVEVFFRREGDVFQSAELTNTTGAGLSYQTEFPTWRSLLGRLFGWLIPDRKETERASGS